MADTPSGMPFTPGQSFFLTGPLPLDLAVPTSAIIGTVASTSAGGHPRIGVGFRPVADANGNGALDACEVAGDLDGDGAVNGTDLAVLLGA